MVKPGICRRVSRLNFHHRLARKSHDQPSFSFLKLVRLGERRCAAIELHVGRARETVEQNEVRLPGQA